jgi:hypothetical protein
MASLDDLLDVALPMNRKERYFTGTVLPALLCSNNLAHLDRLATLLDTGPLEVRAEPDDCTVLMFTEYGIAESLIGEAADRFTDLPPGKDTPDVVILITRPHPVLIALEAKLYDKPGTAALRAQISAQRALLTPITEQLGSKLASPVRLVHAALLPHTLAAKIDDVGCAVITWEQIRDTFRDVAPRYFHAMLTTALRRYPALVSTRTANQDATLPGATLVQRHLAGDHTYPWMGRTGGLTGEALTSDIIERRWPHTGYQCSTTPVPNRNWFSVADFVALLPDIGTPATGSEPEPLDPISG